MNNYQIDISPEAKQILIEWVDLCEANQNHEAALSLIDAYENLLSTLEKQPKAGTGNLQDIPSKYRAILLWKHLWAIYQIQEKHQKIIIEYIIDDRQDYRLFVH